MAQSSSKIWGKSNLHLPRRQATDMPLALPARPAPPGPAHGTNPASLGSSVPASGGEETLRNPDPGTLGIFRGSNPLF